MVFKYSHTRDLHAHDQAREGHGPHRGPPAVVQLAPQRRLRLRLGRRGQHVGVPPQQGPPRGAFEARFSVSEGSKYFFEYLRLLSYLLVCFMVF